MKKTPEDKQKATARNKIRHIENEMRKHPELKNNPLLMERLQFWRKKL